MAVVWKRLKYDYISATDKVLGRATEGAGAIEEIACTAAGRALLDDEAASDQRTTLGLGSGATGFRNIIINGGFTINQRAYASAAALAATVYGHDRWKGGAGGGTYSFTQLASPTTITIAADKTLIQVIEDKNVYGGTYILSWTGSCQARYAINSATPAGDYASSPIIITGQTAGTTMSVEFGNGESAGTLGEVQLELGSVATAFEFRNYTDELIRCQRYYLRITVVGLDAAYHRLGDGVMVSATEAYVNVIFPVTMRTAPTGIESAAANTFAGFDGVTLTVLSAMAFSTATQLVGNLLLTVATGFVASNPASLLANNNNTAYIGFTGAEL